MNAHKLKRITSPEPVVDAIGISQLPAGVQTCVIANYYSKINDADKVADCNGKTTYEAEVKRGDLIFDEQGNYIKKD